MTRDGRRPSRFPMFMIYVLVAGEETGPYTCNQLRDMLESGEIADNLFACTEGMPEWRSVREAMVWDQSRVFQKIRRDFLELVTEFAGGSIDSPDIRMRLFKVLDRVEGADECDPDDLALIVETNGNLLRQHRQFEQDFNVDVLDAFPGRELIFIYKQIFPRDWCVAWGKVGGGIFNNRMIARKDSQAWLLLSDFGFPQSPFSFEPAAWTRDISRDEAVKFGVCRNDDVITRPRPREFRLVGLPK
jgi:hypothetical protein